MTTECVMASFCRNSTTEVGEQRSKCALCRLSPDNTGHSMAHYWRPTRDSISKKHPALIEEQRLIKALAHMYDLRAKYGVNKKKRKVLRKAAIAEKVTEKRIIKATQNSGRRNRDGDHLQSGVIKITLDTKLQTTRENPIIHLAELEKVRKDAVRAGSLVGGLVIRNKNNVGVVVLTESDYAELTRRLLYPEEKQ